METYPTVTLRSKSGDTCIVNASDADRWKGRGYTVIAEHAPAPNPESGPTEFEAALAETEDEAPSGPPPAPKPLAKPTFVHKQG